MGERGKHMLMYVQGISIDEIIEKVEWVIPVITGIAGFLISRIWEYRRLKLEERKAKLDEAQQDMNLQHEDFKDVVGASQKLSDILINVVDPLSRRIATLEDDALKKQTQIIDLNDKILSLTRTLHSKDAEIEELNRKYKEQVEISNQQERKIQAQALRITELEDELNKIKKQKG